MIKPSEVKFTTKNSKQVERQFDDAIRIAEMSGQWPATVGNYRDGISREVVEAVAKTYRAAGWTVHLGSGHRATISLS